MNEPLVSIIMPVRNAADTLAFAVHSVLQQTHSNWELLIVLNDCSDGSVEIAHEYSDERIHVFELSTAGLSHARNEGLKHMRGAYFCFLDADDALPKYSLEARVSKFEDFQNLHFVDGAVVTFESKMQKVKRVWRPQFEGSPVHEINLMQPRCFCGITWMIKRESTRNYSFDETWSHLEDRIFFQSIADQGDYGFVDTETYHIRRRTRSLMSDHRLLDLAFERMLFSWKEKKIVNEKEWNEQKKIYHSIFFKTYIRALHWRSAWRHFVQWIKS